MSVSFEFDGAPMFFISKELLLWMRQRASFHVQEMLVWPFTFTLKQKQFALYFRDEMLESVFKHAFLGAHDEWVEIGKRCSAGRRSMWMRIVFRAEFNVVEAIELKAGREGKDFEMRITNDNPQFEQLLELFLTAHFAATT